MLFTVVVKHEVVVKLDPPLAEQLERIIDALQPVDTEDLKQAVEVNKRLREQLEAQVAQNQPPPGS